MSQSERIREEKKNGKLNVNKETSSHRDFAKGNGCFCMKRDGKRKSGKKRETCIVLRATYRL